MQAFLIANLAALMVAVAAPCMAETAVPSAQTQVEKELWTKEQSIYAGRGRGDLQPYYDNTSSAYLGWPPQVPNPIGREKLNPANNAATGSKEKLEMSFSALTLSGDSALIYYKTHLTMRADGSPADLHYEVIHAWVREQGRWRLLGGMARPSVDR